jgi:hypothetical protein
LRPRRPGLLALSAWLAEAKVTHVAMEATGVYWKPVWHVLCHDFASPTLRTFATCRAARATPTTQPGSPICSPTGLIRASFAPPQPIQELRNLTRTRRELTREIVRHTQRI